MTTAGSNLIPSVEIFAAGRHRDQVYTEADLEDMVRNFEQHKGTVDPPVVIGHEEEQPLAEGVVPDLENTGIPAVGWVTRLYRKGARLFADIAGVFPRIADLIRAGAYRKVSAEVYDEPPEGVPGSGRMLRRVALLGGELPQIKTLADLPPPAAVRHSERRCDRVRLRLAGVSQRSPAGTFRVYFEASGGGPMTPEEALIEKLKAAGIDEALLKPLNPEQLVAFAALADKAMGNPAPTPTEPTDAGGADDATKAAEFPNGMTREQVIAELTDAGEDPAALAAMSDEELIALWTEKKGAPMAEQGKPQPTPTAGTTAVPPPAPGAAPPAQPAAVQPPALPGAPSQVTYKFAEEEKRREERIKAQEERLASLEKRSRQRLAEERKAEVRSFAERMVKEGKLLPADLEAEVELAVSLDAVHVRKFSDGSSGTLLDHWKRRLERRQRHSLFSEKMKQGAGQGGSQGKADHTAALERVRRFAETDRMVAANKARGLKPEQYVAKFSEVLKKRPETTPEEYGVPADFE